jgi:tetratricopeptide (TPR) repeat protein
MFRWLFVTCLIGGCGAAAADSSAQWCYASSSAGKQDYWIVCSGIDARPLQRLNEWIENEDSGLQLRLTQAERWARQYRELKQSLEQGKREQPGLDAAHSSLTQGDFEATGSVLDETIYSTGPDAVPPAQHLYQRALIFSLQFKRLAALADYEKAYRAQPDTFKYCFAYAEALHEAERHSEARQIYEQALALARSGAQSEPADYQPKIAMTSTKLALIALELGDPAAAEKAYRDAVDTYRRLATSNPTAYLPNAAESLNNLGVFYHNSDRLQEAENHYREALDLYRALAQSNRMAYLPDVAGILNNFGILYRRAKRFKETEDADREALASYRELAQISPAAYLPDVVRMLRNLGNLYSRSQNVKKAEKAYREALETLREVARTSGVDRSAEFANTLNDLGTVYQSSQRPRDAAQAYREALEIYRRLATANGAVHLADLAGVLNNLGVALLDMQRLPEAREALREASELRSSLAIRRPELYTSELVETLLNLRRVCYEMGRFGEARRIAEYLVNVYCGCVQWVLSIAMSARPSSTGIPAICEACCPRYRHLRPVSGCTRTMSCSTGGAARFCSSVICSRAPVSCRE